MGKHFARVQVDRSELIFVFKVSVDFAFIVSGEKLRLAAQRPESWLHARVFCDRRMSTFSQANDSFLAGETK